RNTLHLYVRTTYHEILEKQLSDALEPLSITPKELVPAPVRERYEAAIEASKTVAKRAREERGLALRSRRQIAEDMNKARLELRDAKREYATVRAELRGRAQLTAGKRQTPLSYGERLKAANARILEAQQRLDRLKEASEGAPRITASKGPPISENLKAELEKVTKEHALAKAAYSKALESARQSEYADEALFNPLRIRLRELARQIDDKAKAVRKLQGPERDIAEAELADLRVDLDVAKAEWAQAKKNVEGPTFGNTKREIPIASW